MISAIFAGKNVNIFDGNGRLHECMIQTFIERANIIGPPDVSKFDKNRIRKHNSNFCHHDVLVRDVDVIRFV